MKNTRFGSGFVIHRDAHSTYILTCAHVIREIGGAESVTADGLRARVIASGEDQDVDLAIVRVGLRLDRVPLILQPSGAKGMAIRTAGFQRVHGQGVRHPGTERRAGPAGRPGVP
nr:hypothetical protein GCM10020092_022380 [Actinoplanes digitatis]